MSDKEKKSKKRRNTVEIVREIVVPVAERLGYDIWNVEYYKEPTEWILEITIDKADGISIEDCEKMHRAIDPLIDEADPIENSYSLQVSSPGLCRELKNSSHFAKFTGSQVDVKLFAKNEDVGGKTFTGILSAADFTQNTLSFTLDNGTLILIPRKDVAKINLHENISALGV